MIASIKDKTTQDIYDGRNSKAARRLPKALHEIAQRKLDYLNAASRLGDLMAPPDNKLETLKRDLKSYYSIRINDQYRIVFRWNNGNAEDVHIKDYH